VINLGREWGQIFTCDSIGAGTLTLPRAAQTGLLPATTLGSGSDTVTYNSLGAVNTYQATVSGSPVLRE